MSVDISKTLESHVWFANFCSEYKVSPQKLAEVIQLVKDLKKAMGYARRQSLKNDIYQHLKEFGFTEVHILDGEPVFLDTIGDTRRLPEGLDQFPDSSLEV